MLGVRTIILIAIPLFANLRNYLEPNLCSCDVQHSSVTAISWALEESNDGSFNHWLFESYECEGSSLLRSSVLFCVKL